MKPVVLLLAALTLVATPPRSFAGDAKAELSELVEKVKAKIGKGERTEAALAEDLQSFDTLLASHHGEKTDAVAQILFMKALLYMQVLDNEEKAVALFKQLGEEFPDTEPGKKAPDVIASIAAQAESKKIQKALAVGAPFPDFEVKDLDGQPLSVASRKGKVLMIDFWATWCGPCVAELPNVQAAYTKYHDKGFEIIGISLDQDKDKLTSFIKEKQMPWPQYFDGLGWKNKVSTKYGVTGIPATYLLDKEGKILAVGLRGEALDKALDAALK